MTEERTMVKVSMAKGLKVKNRLAGRLAKIDADVRQYNSTLKEQSGKVDVGNLLTKRDSIVAALLELKLALYKGNSGIQAQLYQLGEKKALLAFMSSLNTREGEERHGYQNTPVQYVAVLTKTKVDEQTRKLEGEIDTLQDAVDEYNATKKIEIGQDVLTLAR